MTSPLAQANSIAASDPSQAEQLYKQILKDKAGEFALIICWPDVTWSDVSQQIFHVAHQIL
jgi:hypothetical protein